MKMKSFLTVTILTTLLIVLNFFYPSVRAYSEPAVSDLTADSTGKKEVSNSLKNGMWAIQFAIGSNFNITNFEGMTFSLKRQFSPNSALRLGFRASYDKTENDTNTSINIINNSFEVNLVYMYYLNPKKEFNIFGYAGGTYIYEGSSRHSETSNDNYYQWQTGLLLGAGAEFFVFEQMSLFAEYSYRFLYGKSVYKSVDSYNPNVYNNTYNQISLNPDYVNFGLSVYF